MANADGVHRTLTTRDAAGRPTMERYRGVDGAPVASTQGCHGIRLDRDAQGSIARRVCLDAADQPTARPSGVSAEVYRVDAEGFYWYEGRSDDMIKVRGEWVSPIEIENTLCEYPAVHEAAVVGVPVDGVTTILAAVVLKADYEPSPLLVRELQDWCKGRLQRYQFPHTIDFVTDLPKTATGKIQRFKLRERAA